MRFFSHFCFKTRMDIAQPLLLAESMPQVQTLAKEPGDTHEALERAGRGVPAFGNARNADARWRAALAGCFACERRGV
jgi:hypothetical protein